MSFKRTSRALCLLLVLCLLVGISPIQAEATGITATITGIAMAHPGIALATILVALGVMRKASQEHVFDQLVSDCEAWVRSTTQYITEEGLYLAEYTYNGLKQLFVPEGLVQAVREFLFSTGALQAVTALSGASISATSVAIDSSSSGVNNGFLKLYNSSPENTLALVQSLGVNDKVLILAIDGGWVSGIFFDSFGVLTEARFTNPLGVVNASLYGTFVLSDLELIANTRKAVGCLSLGTTGNTRYSRNVYFSEEYAKNAVDFLTSYVYAFHFAGQLTTQKSYTNVSYVAFPVTSKLSSSTGFGSSVSNVVLDFNSSGYTMLDFTWDTTTYQTVSTDMALNLEKVALPDASIADGYIYWNAGAITIPDSVNIPNQEEERKYLPIVPMDKMEDIYDLTQDEAQTNTATGNPVPDVEEDRVTASGLKGWLDSIKDNFSNWFARISLNVSNILQAVRDGFASLIAAVANIPKLIAGLFRFLAEQVRGIAFIWELLSMLGDYLRSIFSWMPESMFGIVMVTFAIAGLYILIGR